MVHQLFASVINLVASVLRIILIAVESMVVRPGIWLQSNSNIPYWPTNELYSVWGR